MLSIADYFANVIKAPRAIVRNRKIANLHLAEEFIELTTRIDDALGARLWIASSDGFVEIFWRDAVR